MENLKEIFSDPTNILQLNALYSREIQFWEDDKHNIVFVSPICEKATGYTSEEFISDPNLFKSIIFPTDAHIWKDRCSQIEEKELVTVQFRIIHKSGKTVWFENNSQKILNSDQKLIGYFSSNRVMTQKKMFDEIIQSSSSILFLWKNETNYPVEFVSKNVERILGYSVAEFLSGAVSYNDIIHPECKAKVDKEIQTNIKNRHKDFKHEPYRVITKDKRIIWVQDSTVVQEDINKNITHFHGIVKDITQQYVIESNLKSSEQRFKTLVENSPNGIVIHSNGKIQYANRMAINLLRVKSSKDYIGKNVIKYIHPDSRKRVLFLLKNVQEGIRNNPIFETKFLRSDKTAIDVAIASSIIDYGNSKAVQTVFYDITASKMAQDELRKSEERYRSVFSHSPLGILHFDKKSIITDCNEEFAAIIGVQRENLIGFNMAHQVKDKDLKKVVKKCLTTGSGYYENTYTSVLSGKSTSVIGRFNSIYSEDKKIIGGVGLVEDVSERVKSEKLQKALFKISETASKNMTMEELYFELHQIIKELMYAENLYVAMHNRRTNMVSFPYFADMNDTPPADRLFGNGWTEVVLRSEKSQIITPEISEKISKTNEVDLVGKPSLIWIGIYLKFEGDYRGVLALQDYDNPNAYSEEEIKVLQFVSEQIVNVLDKKYADRRLKESIEELSVAKKELEIINNNKDRFFSIIAHDLRAPFNTLLGVTEMISGDFDGMTMKEVKEISSVVNSSTQNLFKLIENLLNWSRLQMGNFKINPEKLSIDEVLLETLEVVKYSANDKSITIDNKISHYNVFADEECVKTVFRNLLNNAIKFTHINGRIEINSFDKNGIVEISVSDNGVGMDNEVAEKLFDITQKTSTVGTENEKGTGLGLILCKDLIEKNNGEIWVESEYGKGSKFSFTLPKFIEK